MILKILYPCDPEKNITCTKEACDPKLCTQTTHSKYAKDIYTYEDIEVVDLETNVTFKLCLEEPNEGTRQDIT